MTRLWPQGENIHIGQDQRGNVSEFQWHGHTHTIAQVRQHWQVDTDWWSEGGAVSRTYFAVITEGGLLCVLYQDRTGGEWYLSKVYD